MNLNYLTIIISLVALVLTIKNVGYSRINMFNIDMEKFDFSYSSVINEAYVSVKLLENTLKKFRIQHKIDFFILQLLFQLNYPIIQSLRIFDSSIVQSEEEKHKKYLRDVLRTEISISSIKPE